MKDKKSIFRRTKKVQNMSGTIEGRGVVVIQKLLNKIQIS